MVEAVFIRSRFVEAAEHAHSWSATRLMDNAKQLVQIAIGILQEFYQRLGAFLEMLLFEVWHRIHGALIIDIDE